MISPRDSLLEDDYILTPETPIQDGVLIANTPSNSTHDEMSIPVPEEICEESKSHYSLADSEVTKYMDSQIHVLVYDHQTSSLTNLISHMNYDVTAIAATSSYLLLLTSRGSILSHVWDPSDCPLASGLTDLTDISSPCLIPGFQLERAIRNKRFTAIACGATFSVALASTGELYTWGEGPYGELGMGVLQEASQPKVRCN